MDISWIGAGTLATYGLTLLPGGVQAITRTEDRHPVLRALGAHPTTSWRDVKDGARLVLSVPGSAAQREVVRRLRTVRPSRVVLVSTVGVYAPYRGRVDATSPVGTSDRARIAFDTENAFRDWAGDRGVIVRLAGLHDDDRGPARAFGRTGTARLAPGNQPLPLIHYRDAAKLVVDALLDLGSDAIRLGVTAAPKRRDYYTDLAERTGHPVPEFAPDLAEPPEFVFGYRGEQSG